MKQRIIPDNSKNISTTTNKTSCVAWFKLAELVTRKEKEKALSLFRLLAHSFENKAYVLQLEGDILWSLEDEQALEKYGQAAFLYKKEQQIVSAVAIYEHILTLQPKSFDALSMLIVLYALLCWPEKFEEYCLRLLQMCDDGQITHDQTFSVFQKVINFSCNISLLKSNHEEYFAQEYDTKKFKWVLKSISLLLKKRNTMLKERIKDYCLEHNLNFKS